MVWAAIAAAFGALAAFFQWRSRREPGDALAKKIAENHDAIQTAENGDTSGVDRAVSQL